MKAVSARSLLCWVSSAHTLDWMTQPLRFRFFWEEGRLQQPDKEAIRGSDFSSRGFGVARGVGPLLQLWTGVSATGPGVAAGPPAHPGCCLSPNFVVVACELFLDGMCGSAGTQNS